QLELPWHLLDLQQLRPDSLLLHFALPQPWNSEIDIQEICPVLELPPNSGNLAEVVPQPMLKKLDYYRRHAARVGDFEIQTSTRKDLPELLEAFLRLHSARWHTRNQDGALASASLQNFYREAADQMLA